MQKLLISSICTQKVIHDRYIQKNKYSYQIYGVNKIIRGYINGSLSWRYI